MRRTGFTIIELLVTVSIIALLIAILLPSMGKAIDAAKRVKCASQLHQIGTGMNLYAVDHQGAWPNRGSDANREPHQMVGSIDLQTAFIDPYLIDRDAMMFCPSRLLDARNPQVYKRQTGFVTYQYHVYNKDNRWLVDKPQLLRISQVNGVYPLWSCLTINRPTGELYFGHDRPIVATPPDGLNSVFTDGSAAWTEWDDCENYFLDVSVQFYVWPKAVR